MKVLHINPGNMYGGIESFLVTLARRRADCPSMEPVFAICYTGRLEHELQSTGVETVRLPGARLSRPWTILAARRAFARTLERQKPSVVVTHGSWPHVIFAPVAKSRGIPVVQWIHGLGEKLGILERWASLTTPDMLFLNSKSMTSFALRLFGQIDHELVYCPLELERYQRHDREAGRQALAIPQERVVILQVGRLEPYKGHVLHLNALSFLKDLPHWETWIVGGPQSPREHAYLEELKSLAERTGIAERVRFLGQRSDVPALLSAADIFCQPNRDPEPFGLVFVEALAAQLPVVSTDFGGASEIVTPACGRLSPPGDAKALSVSLAELIQDADLRQSLGANGPSRASELCDAPQQMNKIGALIAGLATRK